MHDIEFIEDTYEKEIITGICNICDKKRTYNHCSEEMSFDDERIAIIKAFHEWITPLPCI